MIFKFQFKYTFICVKFLILSLLFSLISVISYGAVSLSDDQLSCIKGCCKCTDQGYPQCPGMSDCLESGARCIYCRTRRVGWNCSTIIPKNCTPSGEIECGSMYEGTCRSLPLECQNGVQIGACKDAYLDCTD